MLQQAATQTEGLPTLAGYALFAYLVIKEVIGLVKPYLARKNGHTNGNSGEKSVDYWRMEFRQAIEEKVGDELHEQAEVLGEIRDGINKLVTIAESRRRGGL